MYWFYLPIQFFTKQKERNKKVKCLCEWIACIHVSELDSIKTPYRLTNTSGLHKNKNRQNEKQFQIEKACLQQVLRSKLLTFFKRGFFFELLAIVYAKCIF